MLQVLTSWPVLMIVTALLMALALGIEPATPGLIVIGATERVSTAAGGGPIRTVAG